MRPLKDKIVYNFVTDAEDQIVAYGKADEVRATKLGHANNLVEFDRGEPELDRIERGAAVTWKNGVPLVGQLETQQQREARERAAQEAEAARVAALQAEEQRRRDFAATTDAELTEMETLAKKTTLQQADRDRLAVLNARQHLRNAGRLKP